MADLLLELFSEEIPARMQADALAHLKNAIADALAKDGFAIAKDQAKGFVTPRRIAIWLAGLPVSQPATETEIKGPKLGAPEAALQGFLKKNNLQMQDLVERDGVYFAMLRKEGRQTADALKTIIESTLASFPWPKSMRWGSGDATWVRPLHSILCLFDGAIVPVTFAGVTAGNGTRGHRFLAPAAITVSKPEEYEALLHDGRVMADREARKAEIVSQAQKAAAAAGLVLKKDDGLLEEVTGLVEWPTVLTGTIDAQFMDLPKEVLVSEMRAHQKYFALENKDGSLSDKFLITANMTAQDGGKAIVAGNERVLRARLSDGRFFWDQDRKKPLEEWAQGLASVTFHAKLGTIADKAVRIRALALLLAGYVAGADKAQVERAAMLCKADLVTGMVGEFPELQGVMGRYYAQAGEAPPVADAIRDHYLPLGPTSPVPSQPVSICVALADKLDTLISMFAIGEKPTGSKDPFALRRAALGVIRIILDNGIRLPLRSLFCNPPATTIALHNAQEKLKEQTEARLKESHKIGKYLTVNESAYQDLCEAVPEGLSDTLYEFFIDRLKVQLKDQGIRHDVINAVVANGDDDLARVVARAKALQQFLTNADGTNLLIAYRRAANILAIEEKKDNNRYNKPIDLLILTTNAEEAEQKLFISLHQTQPKIAHLISEEKYTQALSLLATLRLAIDQFFDEIMVNSPDEQLRINRLNLLACIRNNMDSIADFSKIEG